MKEYEGTKCENCEIGKFEYDEKSETLVCSCCDGVVERIINRG